MTCPDSESVDTGSVASGWSGEPGSQTEDVFIVFKRSAAGHTTGASRLTATWLNLFIVIYGSNLHSMSPRVDRLLCITGAISDLRGILNPFSRYEISGSSF